MFFFFLARSQCTMYIYDVDGFLSPIWCWSFGFCFASVVLISFSFNFSCAQNAQLLTMNWLQRSTFIVALWFVCRKNNNTSNNYVPHTAVERKSTAPNQQWLLTFCVIRKTFNLLKSCPWLNSNQRQSFFFLCNKFQTIFFFNSSVSFIRALDVSIASLHFSFLSFFFLCCAHSEFFHNYLLAAR